jgi:hypothetical protein
MSNANSRTEVIERRGILLAELLFQDLKADFISRSTQDADTDFLVGFSNAKAGVNTFSVQIKATEKPVTKSGFAISKSVFNRLAYSNVPGLLIVVDVKQNRLYYAWLKPENSKARGDTVLVSLSEIDEKANAELKAQLTRVYGGHAVAG